MPRMIAQMPALVGQVSVEEDGLNACGLGEPSEDDLGVNGVQFHQYRPAPGHMGCDQRYQGCEENGPDLRSKRIFANRLTYPTKAG